MILYNIQHFGDPQWLPWLVTTLSHRDNRFLITYDGDAQACAQISEALMQTPLEARGVHVEPSLPIRWCGPSQIRMQMDAIRRALAFPSWSHFINLSGTCFPLRPQTDIQAHLRRSYAAGIEAHLFSFRQRKPVTLPEEDPHGLVQRLRLNRLHIEGNTRLLEMFGDAAYFPVRNAANRLFLTCSEPNEPGLLAVGRPSDEEIAFRQSYLQQYPHYCGRAWYTLHRSACEKLVAFFDAPEFADSARLFLNCFEPDESFLQTIIMNGLVLDVDRVEKLPDLPGQPRTVFGC